MGFCEFQAVKFSQRREIHRCTRKRQGCTRNRHTSGRGSPPDRSIRLCACGTLRTADWYNKLSNDSWTSAEERGSAILVSSHGMGPLGSKSCREFRSKFRVKQFLPSALQMLFKEISLDLNVAVSPEKHPFSTWSCKSGKYYTALTKLNIQRVEPGFLERKFFQTRNKSFSSLAL